MTTSNKEFRFKGLLFLLLCTLLLVETNAQELQEIKGIVKNTENGKALATALVQLEDSNISTRTNAEGEFLLKVPETALNGKIITSLAGFKSKKLRIKAINENFATIDLKPTSISLDEVSVSAFKSPRELIKRVFERKKDNYLDSKTVMTSFYRETIKKRRRNVSLSEAVVNVYKQPYQAADKDYISLIKSRKSTDYTKLDTVALKLQGGPFNTLYVDVMKYPEYIFTDEMIEAYDFSFSEPTEINGKNVYVVDFKQKENVIEALYYGKLYITNNTLALVKAEYSLDLTYKKKAAAIFVRKKPDKIKVTPLAVDFKVDYQNKNGKWYYSYSNAALSFKVNKKRKLFNATYSLSCEMAVTDWNIETDNATWSSNNKLKKSIILADEASGFADPEFWGDYNVIEPENSIESVIRKINKRMKKENKGSGTAMGKSTP